MHGVGPATSTFWICCCNLKHGRRDACIICNATLDVALLRLLLYLWLSFSPLNLSLPRCKVTFSQPFKENCMPEVVRIGSIIIFHLSKPVKSQVLHTVWCKISGEVAGEMLNFSLLAEKGLGVCLKLCSCYCSVEILPEHDIRHATWRYFSEFDQTWLLQRRRMVREILLRCHGNRDRFWQWECESGEFRAFHINIRLSRSSSS